MKLYKYLSEEEESVFKQYKPQSKEEFLNRINAGEKSLEERLKVVLGMLNKISKEEQEQIYNLLGVVLDKRK